MSCSICSIAQTSITANACLRDDAASPHEHLSQRVPKGEVELLAQSRRNKLCLSGSNGLRANRQASFARVFSSTRQPVCCKRRLAFALCTQRLCRPVANSIIQAKVINQTRNVNMQSPSLKHDPEKWEPVFGKRSCSNK